ncbi:RadC family protein [Shouchella lonarensis]|uniref:DNA replication and repair protein RadC n=1 Tax=Shouchella lonarensis TaxID=1464122 RepID=A0A1G6GIF7_9BACI|nr:DNA repair protein RadC [Shouchella lonarensis]SDB81535.1 DNA replication and repair protein RadC [Shouchella lonarensis]
MAILIRDVPEKERPRERLLREGARALSNQEIIAILLRSGTKAQSVVHLASQLLSRFPTLTALKEAAIEELCTVNGIGAAKAVELTAAIELGRRIHMEEKGDRHIISTPDDAAHIMMEELRELKQEHFVALYLNSKNHVMKKQTLFVGSLNASIVHPREVFKEALRYSSAAVICLHNHPSGDPEPSREDVYATERLSDAGRLLGIPLLDHIIIGDGCFVSLKERGLLAEGRESGQLLGMRDSM